jgi:hypothetical protein
VFDHFWYFDMLVEDEAAGEAEIAGSCPFCGIFGLRVFVTGMGCQPMGLPMFRTHL